MTISDFNPRARHFRASLSLASILFGTFTLAVVSRPATWPVQVLVYSVIIIAGTLYEGVLHRRPPDIAANWGLSLAVLVWLVESDPVYALGVALWGGLVLGPSVRRWLPPSPRPESLRH